MVRFKGIQAQEGDRQMPTKSRSAKKDRECLKTCVITDWTQTERTIVSECHRQGDVSRRSLGRIAFCGEVLARCFTTFIHEYLPESDWNLFSYMRLIDTFDGSGKHNRVNHEQPIDLVFDQLRSGEQYIIGKGCCEKVATKFKRRSDGAQPSKNTHGAELYGFWPGEDRSLDLFDRYCYITGPNYERAALDLLAEAVMRVADRSIAEQAASDLA